MKNKIRKHPRIVSFNPLLDLVGVGSAFVAAALIAICYL
jgi:hypothetical protein